jgi:inorganic pyrophosphatase
MKIDALPPTAGKGLVHVVVETPRHSTAKLKYEPALGQFALKRALPLGFVYPYDWGFVPGTEAEDGDPVDALVLWESASPPGTVLRCRLLGVLEVSQRAGPNQKRRIRNDRILAVPERDPRTAALRDLDDLTDRVREELAHFFVASLRFEPKDPRIEGWSGPAVALALVKRSARR